MPADPSSGPLSVEDYLHRVLDTIAPIAPFEHSLMDAIGLPAAEDVPALVSLPVFDNSGMDGYAVSFRDVADASPERPVHLPVVGEITAGDSRAADLTPGTAVRIMTGAAVPAGCTAVVPFEWTTADDREVVIARAPAEGQHIRYAGEEIAEGEVLLQHGEIIGPRQLGLLAAGGVGRVLTSPRPRVVVMSTGSELVEPGRRLQDGQIYDANSFLLASAVRAHGGVPYRVQATSDDPAAFSDALSDQLVRADLIITSGGVSKGTRDVVKEVLGGLGTVDFLEVAMQPGKPQGFGFVGEDRTPIFCLPGNPVSSYVSFEMFVVPALRKLVGRDAGMRELVTARLTESVRSVRDKLQLLRARTDLDADGLRVTPQGGPGSHLIGGLARSDALILLDADVTRAEAGDHVPVLLLDPTA